MSTLADIRPGQVLGRYEFLAPIAQGGMASVWAARQWGSRGFSKIVAVKMMLPTISDDPKFERMFLDEARIASKIRHNHVVEILDLGEQNSVLYLVMEWVDGESLSAIRRYAAEKGGVPIAVAVRIIADVCSGLHAAHELRDDEGQPIGLVHRDVSPQNILVGYDGVSKVLDFGVAKVAGRTTDTTNVGHARGKPPYMAPEQALGHPIDRRADVFSLGIVLYQLITGKHPFRGENDIATLHNIISEQPVISPKAFISNLPDGLERIMLSALERNPAKRFQSAREMELSLESLFDEALGRIRSEEIGRLVSVWLGVRGEERRSALREAIKRADNAETPSDGRGVLRKSASTNMVEPSQPEAKDVNFGSPAKLSQGDVEAYEKRQLKSVLSTRQSVDQSREFDEESQVKSSDQTIEIQERTIVDQDPNLFRSNLSAKKATKYYDRNGRNRFLSRMGFIIVLAMSTSALATWAFVSGLRSKTETRSLTNARVEERKKTGNLTQNREIFTERKPEEPARVTSEVNVETAAPSILPSTVPTVIPDVKPFRGNRQNTQSKKRPPGPSYNLPPIPSPGF
jgi:serine/threonine-protein kinase